MKKLTESSPKSVPALFSEFEAIKGKLRQKKQEEDFKNDPEYWTMLNELSKAALAVIKAAKK